MSNQKPDKEIPPARRVDSAGAEPSAHSGDSGQIDPQAAFEMGADSSAPTAPAFWSPPEAEVLDPLFVDYTITRLIGRGGMGAVYEGVQTSLDRPVAIKVLPPELAEADPSFATRFEREAKSMARLDHPNIVHVHDFGRTDAGHWFIVMEYVDGVDFHQLIRSGELDTSVALTAVSQICDALEYAHGMGYIHRDIKPDNIFINRKGTLKVGDFGLAKLIGETAEGADPDSHRTLTMTGSSMGTPAYCAPEQLEGRATDHRADIYSLGVMFYEMLTKELPRGNFQPPSQKTKVDSRIDDVVLRAMESERDRRYSTAGEMRTDLDAAATPPPLKSDFEENSSDTNTKQETTPMTSTTNSNTNLPTADEKANKAKPMGIAALIFLGLAILTSPFMIALLEETNKMSPIWVSVAIIASLIFLVVAFVLGIIGWNHVTGKIAAIVSPLLGFLSVVVAIVLVFYLSVPMKSSRSYEESDGGMRLESIRSIEVSESSRASADAPVTSEELVPEVTVPNGD
ncbi:MAG: protein kinase [Akkermansiaceae bacterium]